MTLHSRKHGVSSGVERSVCVVCARTYAYWYLGYSRNLIGISNLGDSEYPAIKCRNTCTSPCTSMIKVGPIPSVSIFTSALYSTHASN